MRAFSRLTSPWIGGTRCQRKKEESRCASARKGLSRPAAGSKASWDRRPPAASVPPDPLDVVGSSFQVRPTAVRLLPCTPTRSGCLFPCHLASPGPGEASCLLSFLPAKIEQIRAERVGGLGLEALEERALFCRHLPMQVGTLVREYDVLCRRLRHVLLPVCLDL